MGITSLHNRHSDTNLYVVLNNVKSTKWDFVDRILEEALKEKVISLHNERASAKQIQNELNISKVWIEQVCAEYDEKLREDNTSAPY